VSQVAKTFSQLKAETSSSEQEKLARLESHAILEEIGALHEAHLDNQVSLVEVPAGIQNY
jgi:uncharacterized protein YydD (DUF2326 family)